MKCAICHQNIEKCTTCDYIHERLSDVVKCLNINGQKYHFCNDDCLIDFVFLNFVSESHTTE